jgi:hypothetical protein
LAKLSEVSSFEDQNVTKKLSAVESYRKTFEISQKCNSRSIDPKVWKNFLPRSRRRATVERLRRDGLIIIFIRREAMVVKIL